MGQAKQRGTFEERKAQAVEAGRLKVRYNKPKLRQDIQAIIAQQLLKGLLKNR